MSTVAFLRSAKIAALLFVLTAFVTGLRGQVTIGNPIVDHNNRDGAQTTYLFAVQSFGSGANGYTLSTWSFYANAGTTGEQITPLLFENVGGNIILRAIGTTQTVTANTAYIDLAFGPVEGSALIDSANFYFGWKDGSQTSPNQGVISFDSSGGGAMYALSGNSMENITGIDIGNAYDFSNNVTGRVYSVSATAIEAIPEPANVATFVGALAVGVVAWRRRRTVATE